MMKCSLALFGFLLVMSQPSLAETNGEMLKRVCPIAVNIQNHYDRAKAIDSDAQYDFALQSAAAYYDCTLHLPKSYPQEFALYEYGFLMWSSTFDTTLSHEVVLRRLLLVTTAMTQLINTTDATNIKELAIPIRNGTQEEYREMYKIMYGTLPI